ncbi:MAG: hypothetical protein K0Q91_2288 [Fibrobacteria bacterium]|jgi:uncharacterized membrane protein|nr:hypothetical protein [Fibrobacteria bacterium]
MLKYIVAYAATLIVMLAVDLAWLGVLAKKLYVQALGPLLAPAPNIPAAVAFYLLYPLGLMVFVIAPSLASGSWTQALVRGALFGFFAYMTYEFTNLALIRGWPASLVAVDIAWGVVLTALVSAAGHIAGKWVS